MKRDQQKVTRPVEDVQEAMREQVLLLMSHCEHYDQGERAFAKPAAAVLRLLIHQTWKSHSLLDQLGLRSGRYFTAAPPLNPKNLATECNLVALRFRAGPGGRASYVARLMQLTNRDRKPFSEWWVAPVLKGVGGVTMSRKDVVTAVGDMDGGAHVDPGLETVYARFRSGELLNWQYSAGTGPAADATYVSAPQYACIRTIAHELLLTMQKYAPWSLSRPYTFSEPD